MSQETRDSSSSLIPPKPIPAEAQAFTRQMHGLMDGQPKDDATVSKALEGMDGMFDLIAAGLYSMASMLVGEGEESIRLVEMAVADAEVSVCDSPAQARQSSRRALSRSAIEILAKRNPGDLAAPQGLKPAVTCIEDDDLDSVGVSREELQRMIAGPDRDRVRKWLESLPLLPRTVFVLRAVGGFTAAETAELLEAHGGPEAAGWNADAAREFFRQALCSLASQLIHATASR